MEETSTEGKLIWVQFICEVSFENNKKMLSPQIAPNIR